MNLEKNFLRHFFRFRNELPAQNGNREAENASTVATHQLAESLLVAALCAGHEFGIALHER